MLLDKLDKDKTSLAAKSNRCQGVHGGILKKDNTIGVEREATKKLEVFNVKVIRG